ncbi:DMT family transporter [Streptomyces sp. NBC_00620]|uniref:DMT family transporter n=1 Tax=Streptomyces sp. NBC_00620 TaxID=2903666 RepID=UPI002257B3F4|nr:DMT family transporter [Streptomyces sp. NBC_00620]MCX4978487.1 DMT family transporter [Streptomyces sp. NBC_00620]
MTASPVFLAVALSLVSAVCYATAAVVQERTAAGTPDLRDALTRVSWWWAVLLNATGALLHVVALRYGPLTLVQPLGALTLVVAVPLGSLAARRRTSGTQWRGMALTLVGLTALLTATASGNAPDSTLRTTEVLLIALAAATAILALIRIAPSGLGFAAASGIASGVGSTLAQKLAVGPAVSWSAAVVAVLTVSFAAAGLMLSQKAYRSGLGGPLALLTLVNPVTASVIGITLLGEGFQYGATGTLLALAGAAAAARGVVLLSRSQSHHDHPDGGYGRPRVPRPAKAETVPGLRPTRLFTGTSRAT